jgi:digeranylgeranylglycerophospholipid reductase
MLESGPGGVRARAGAADITARLVILATGANYALHRRFGLGLPSAYLHTAQREFPAGRLRDVELHFGSSVAPAGFAWAVPVQRPTGPHVRIGIMAAGAAPTWFAQMYGRMQREWQIDARPEPPRLKILPLGPISRTCADRLLVIGDAAGLVKPTTGGGIYYALVSAGLAADVAASALRTARYDTATLAAYETRWRRRLSAEFDSQTALRRVAVAMTDPEIDELFELARTDGIIPIVRRTARFNRYRRFILELFRHPPARRVLFRAMGG